MIEIKNLYSFYNSNTLSIDKGIKDISCTFKEGEITVLLGPNGSGKTTLIKTILGLLKKDRGEILIDKKERIDMSEKEIALKCSYLSQEKVIPSITAFKMVMHGRFPHLSWPRHYSKKDKDIVIDAMKETGCYSYKDSLLTSLSGGERQKVYLALTLAQETSHIFFDEPTTYLDVEHQLSFMNMAKKLKEKGRCVVMVLHDIPLSLSFADKILLMKDGEVIKYGECENIFNSGALDKVFNVKVLKSEIDGKSHYYIESKGEEE